MAPAVTDGARTRGHKKKLRTRAQLLSAAVDVIAERGEAFSVGDITELAGVSHGTFYNYFEDREALIEAIVPEALDGFAAASAVAVASEDPAQRFAAISTLALRRAAAEPERARVLFRLQALRPRLDATPAFDHLRADLAAGAASGRFVVGPGEATVDVVVGALLAASRRIAEEAMTGVEATADGYAANVVAQLLRSLGVAADEARRLADQAEAELASVATAG